MDARVFAAQDTGKLTFAVGGGFTEPVRYTDGRLNTGFNITGGALTTNYSNGNGWAIGNGGPGTADNAIAAAGDDEDLFVEDLEFDETRLYVRRVMENYARYRQLYEGINRPSLPR